MALNRPLSIAIVGRPSALAGEMTREVADLPCDELAPLRKPAGSGPYTAAFAPPLPALPALPPLPPLPAESGDVGLAGDGGEDDPPAAAAAPPLPGLATSRAVGLSTGVPSADPLPPPLPLPAGAVVTPEAPISAGGGLRVRSGDEPGRDGGANNG